MTLSHRLAAKVVATSLGTGYSPIAPGTVSSLLVTVFFALAGAELPRSLQAAGLGAILLAGFWSCRTVIDEWGPDPSRVTIDEVAGCWIASAAAPRCWGITGLAAAFVLFRAADIIKPWPVNLLDRTPGCTGVMMDDVAAGIMAGALILAGWSIYGCL